MLCDFWAGWAIYIYYMYFVGISASINEKLYKYAKCLYGSRDYMGNIVYTTIRNSSMSECYEKGIVV